MPKFDPEHEKRRLAEFYAGQMDGELEKVAKEAYELTGLAREALRAELTKRGSGIALVEQTPAIAPPIALPGDPPPEAPPVLSSPEGELEMQEMVTIRNFRDLPEALLAKGSLDSAGINCALIDDNMVRLDWFWSNLMGGVKLQVQKEDAAIAKEILDQPIPESFDVTGVGEYDQPHCPNCQSLDVNYREISPAAYVSAMVSVPIPFHRRAWRCRACLVEWEDDGVPGPTGSTA
jgi:hypothetical protein